MWKLIARLARSYSEPVKSFVAAHSPSARAAETYVVLFKSSTKRNTPSSIGVVEFETPQRRVNLTAMCLKNGS